MGNVGYKPPADLTQYYADPAQQMGGVQRGAAAVADPAMPDDAEQSDPRLKASRVRPMSEALQYRRQRER
jgi:hypothetical protein